MNPAKKVKIILGGLTGSLCNDDPLSQGGRKINFDGSSTDLLGLSFQAFVNRSNTFKPEDWNSNPNAVLLLSKYGFKSLAGCKVRCCSCGVEVDVGLFLNRCPRDVLITIALKSHKQFCRWIRVSTSDEYFSLSRNPHRSLQDLKVTFTEMMTFQTNLPIILKDKWEKMGISEAFMKSVLTSLEQTYSDTLASCVVLSLCGWVKRNEETLQCNFCQRVVDVWNFICANVQRSRSSMSNGRPSKQSRVVSLLYGKIRRSVELREASEEANMSCEGTTDPTVEPPCTEQTNRHSEEVTKQNEGEVTEPTSAHENECMVEELDKPSSQRTPDVVRKRQYPNLYKAVCKSSCDRYIMERESDMMNRSCSTKSNMLHLRPPSFTRARKLRKRAVKFLVDKDKKVMEETKQMEVKMKRERLMSEDTNAANSYDSEDEGTTSESRKDLSEDEPRKDLSEDEGSIYERRKGLSEDEGNIYEPRKDLSDGEGNIYEPRKDLSENERDLSDDERDIVQAERERCVAEMEPCNAGEDLSDVERDPCNAAKDKRGAKREIHDAKRCACDADSGVSDNERERHEAERLVYEAKRNRREAERDLCEALKDFDSDIYETDLETEFVREVRSDISSNSASCDKEQAKASVKCKSYNNGASCDENSFYSSESDVREIPYSHSVKSDGSSLGHGTNVIESNSATRSSNNLHLDAEELDETCCIPVTLNVVGKSITERDCVTENLDRHPVNLSAGHNTFSYPHPMNYEYPMNYGSSANSDGRRKRKRVPESERNGIPYGSGLLPRYPVQKQPAHFTRSKRKEMEMMLNERTKYAKIPSRKDNVAEVIDLISSSENESKANSSEEQEDNDKVRDKAKANTCSTKRSENIPAVVLDAGSAKANTCNTKGSENNPVVDLDELVVLDAGLAPVICSVVGNAEIHDSSEEEIDQCVDKVKEVPKGPIIVSAKSVCDEGMLQDYVEEEGRKFENGCRTKSHTYDEISDSDSPIVSSSPEKPLSVGKSYDGDTSGGEDTDESPVSKRKRIETDEVIIESEHLNSGPMSEREEAQHRISPPIGGGDVDDFTNDQPPSYFHPEFEHRFWCIWRVQVATGCGLKKGWELYMAAIQKGLDMQNAKKIAICEVENNALGCLADIITLTKQRKK